MTKNKEVTAFIDEAIEEQKEILLLLRNLIEKTVPNAMEQFKWSRPVYETEKGFCYLATTKKHVTLGFYDAEKVDDPKKLLEGTGKKMRHIKIRKMEDVQSDVFAKMIEQAAKFE